MNKTIVLPVTVGKKEILGKSIPSIIELTDKYIKLTMKYKFQTPKDVDDEYSTMQDRLSDYESICLKSSINALWYIWDREDWCYVIEWRANGGGFAFNLESREKCMEIYDQLLEWWLNK